MSGKKIVIIALFTAIMFILTGSLVFPLGPFGYLNLSDFLIMLIAPYFSYPALLLIAGAATALADVALSYAHFAFFTFLIKSAEAWVIHYLLKQKQLKSALLAFLAADIILLGGYGLTDIILTGQAAMFWPSLSANFPQAVVSTILARLALHGFKTWAQRYLG